MNRALATLLFFFVALAAGEGAYWFIGGVYQSQTPVRNALVVAQLLICVVAMVWLGQKMRRSERASQAND